MQTYHLAIKKIRSIYCLLKIRNFRNQREDEYDNHKNIPKKNIPTKDTHALTKHRVKDKQEKAPHQKKKKRIEKSRDKLAISGAEPPLLSLSAKVALLERKNHRH